MWAKRFLTTCCVLAALSLWAAKPSLAVSIEWQGPGGSAWANGGSWVGGSAPGPLDLAQFLGKGTGNVDIGGGSYTVSGLNFSSGPYTLIDSLSGGSLSLATLTHSGGSNVINLKLSSPSLAATISGGQLSLNNTANPISGGTWTVSNGATLNAQATATAGASALGGANLAINGSTVQVYGAGSYTAGLRELKNLGNAFDETTKNTSSTFQLYPRAGETNGDGLWADNTTWVYTGQVYDPDGLFTFAENIDDNCSVRIDGVLRLRNTTWNHVTNTSTTTGYTGATAYANDNTYGGTTNFGMGPLGDGWHDIEIRMGNGTGGAGAVTDATLHWVGNTRANGGYGFGFSSSSTTSFDANNYVIPTDPGTGTLFRATAYGAIDLSTTDVAVTGASTLAAITDTTATFRNLTLSNGANLTTSGGGLIFASIAPSTAVSGQTLTLTMPNNVTSALYTDNGVATNLIKNGTGTLTLSSVTAVAGSSFRANGGTLATYEPNPLGSASSLILGGATFLATSTANNAINMGGTDLSILGTSTLTATTTNAGGITLRNLSFGGAYTLTMTGAKDTFASTAFAAGSALVMNGNGALLGPVTTNGSASLSASAAATATPASFNDQGVPGTFRVFGNAILKLDNTVPGTVVANNTIFEVDASATLNATGALPLGAGATNISLVGGTLIANPVPANSALAMGNTSVGVSFNPALNLTATSTINVPTTNAGGASFGPLSFSTGAILATTGATGAGGMAFASTAMGAAGIAAGFGPAASTRVYGPLNGNGYGDTIYNLGRANMILNQPAQNMAGTTIESRGGRIITVGPDPVAGANLNVSGGTWVFASPDGHSITIPNAIGSTNNGTILADSAGIGTPGGKVYLSNLQPTDGALVQMKVGDACAIVLSNGVNELGGSLDIPNALAHYGYHINNDGATLDLNNNGGAMGSGRPASYTSFFGKQVLTTGPAGRGLDFNDDGDFINSGAIGQNDNYSDLFIMKLHVVDAALYPTAPNRSGTWYLRINAQDDPCGAWIDLNQNGLFESTTAGLGSGRGEQILWNQAATSAALTLNPGDYLIAFTHREGGGGSQIDAQFQSPGLAMTTIRPADPTQAGFWSAPSAPGGLEIAQGQTRTNGPLKLGSLIIDSTGTLIRNGLSPASGTRDITVTDTLTLNHDLAMTHGEVLTTTGATVNVNAGATLYVNQPVNAANLNLQGSLVRMPVGAGDITVTNSLTLAGVLDMTKGGALNTAGANITVTSTGSLTAAAPLVAGSVSTSGTLKTPGGTMADLVINAGTTTVTGDLTLTNSLHGSGGTLVTSAPGSLTIDPQKALAFTGTLHVSNPNLTLNVPATTPLSAGIVAYWPLDAADINGTKAFDLSGNGNDGILYNSPSQVSGMVGGGLNFNGTNQYLEAANSPSLNVNSPFTVGVWMKSTDAGTWYRNLMGNYGNSGTQTAFWGLGWIDVSRLGFVVRDTGSVASKAQAPDNRGLDGNWHYVMGVRGNGVAQFYVDGTLAAQVADTTGSVVNAKTFDAAYYNAQGSKTALDDMAIWNRALTSTEAMAVYQRGVNGLGLAPAALGSIALDPGTQLTFGGTGAPTVNSVSAVGGPTVAGPMTLGTGSGPAGTLAASADAKTLTLDAPISNASFQVTGPGTVALKQNLTVASGGTLGVAAGSTLTAKNSLTIDAGSATLSMSSGNLNVAAGTLTLRMPPGGGTIIASDNFESYAAGSALNGQNGGSGWSGAWLAQATEVTAQAGVIPGLGQSLQILSTTDNSNMFQRAFPAQTGTLYVGFNLRTTGGWDTTDFILWYLNNTVGASDTVGVSGGVRNVSPSPYFARIDGPGSDTNSTVSHLDDVTVPVVLKLSRTGANYDRVDLYINGAPESTPTVSQTTGSSGVSSLSQFHFRTFNIDTGQKIFLDNLRIATSYDAALTGATAAASIGNVTLAAGTTLDLADAAGTSGAGSATFTSLAAGNGSTIRGHAILSGPVTVGSSPGTLYVQGSFATAAGAVYTWETQGNAAGQSDLIAVSGTPGDLDLTAPWTLAITPLKAVHSGTYDLFTYTGSLNPATPSATLTAAAGACGELVNLAGSSITTSPGKVSLNLAMNNFTQWTGGGSPNTAWNVSNNWDSGLPSTTNAAVVNAAGPTATITAAMGQQTANSLIVDTGGSVLVGTGGSLQVSDGTALKNVWVQPTGNMTILGTVSAASITSSGNLVLGHNASLIATPYVLPAGAAAYYAFDSVNGSVIANGGSLGTAYNGSLMSGATLTTGGGGFHGEAMSLPGANSEMLINLVGGSGVDLSGGNWTATAWYYNLAPTGAWRTLFRGNTNDHEIIVNNAAGSQLLGEYDNAGGGNFRSTGYTMDTVAAGWHQITAVGSGTTTSMYIDGVLVGTADRKSVADIYSVGNHWGGGQRFADLIDEVYIYQRALSATEVANLYQYILTNGGSPSMSAINVTGGTTTGQDTTLGAQTTLNLSGGVLAGSFTSLNPSTTAGSCAYEVSGGVSNAILRGDTASLHVPSTAGTSRINGPVYLNAMSVEGGTTTIADNDTLRLNSLSVSGGTLNLNRESRIGTVTLTGGTTTTTRNMTVTGGLLGSGGTLVADGSQVLDLSSAGAVVYGGTIRVTSSSPANSGDLVVKVPTPGLSLGTSQNFDSAGTSYFLRNEAGSPYLIQNQGAPNNNYVRLLSNVGSTANQIAFDRTLTGPYSSISAAFDMRFSSSVGGADGASFVLLPTAKYGTSGSGPNSPPWEEPNIAGAFGVGFDIYPNLYEVSLHWNGTNIANVQAYDYRDKGWETVNVNVNYAVGGAYVSVAIAGNPIYTNYWIAGMTPYESRPLFGARDGGAVCNFDVDNVNVQMGPGLASLGNVQLDPHSQFTLGGYAAASLASIGATNGITITGPVTLAGSTPKVTSDNAQTLTVLGSLAGSNVSIGGTGTVTLKNNLTVNPGGSLSVLPGATLASQGNNLIDASAASVFVNALNVDGTLTMNVPDGTLYQAVSQNFDAAGTAYTLVQRNGGNAPSILNEGTPQNNVAHLLDRVGNESNMLAFDRTVTGTKNHITADFKFNIGPAGADGAGFALLNTANNGTTGAPTSTFGESPNIANTFGVGFDIYNNANGSTNYYLTTLHWNGAIVASTQAYDYRNAWQQAHLDVQYVAGGAYVSLSIAGTSLFSNTFISGMTPYESRVAFGGRTGGVNTDLRVDDINVRMSDMAQLGAVNITPGSSLILSGPGGSAGTAGFTSITSGHNATIDGNVYLSQLLDPTGTLHITHNIDLGDGAVVKFDLTPDPADLIQAASVAIDRTFTLELFGAGASLNHDDWLQIFAFNPNTGLTIGGQPWDGTDASLNVACLIQVANFEDPLHQYYWDTCDMHLVHDDAGIYLTGLVAQLVPEPCSLLLLGLGALALARRKRTRKASRRGITR